MLQIVLNWKTLSLKKVCANRKKGTHIFLAVTKRMLGTKSFIFSANDIKKLAKTAGFFSYC